MKELLTVKQFAELCGVSIRTLQYYDNIGLLKPEAKNDSSYRYYVDAQIYQIQIINILKNLGFNLKAIKIILLDKSLNLIDLLELQLKNVKHQIQSLTKTHDLLTKGLEIYHKEQKLNNVYLLQVLNLLTKYEHNQYKEWFQRNFTDDELGLFIEIAKTQNQAENTKIWVDIFNEARKIMHLGVNHPKAYVLGNKAFSNASHQYQASPLLRQKMWALMKTGDIPGGLITGYDKNVVLFLSQIMDTILNRSQG